MDVSGPEANHRGPTGGVDALPGRGSPAGTVGKDAQQGGLVQAVGPVRGLYPQNYLFPLDAQAFLQGEDLSFIGGYNTFYELQRFVDATEQTCFSSEKLHGAFGIKAFAFQDLLRPSEVDVGCPSGKHPVRKGKLGFRDGARVGL